MAPLVTLGIAILRPTCDAHTVRQARPAVAFVAAGVALFPLAIATGALVAWSVGGVLAGLAIVALRR